MFPIHTVSSARDIAFERIVEAIRAYGVLPLPDRDDVHAYAGGDVDLPVVFGNTCEDVMIRKMPAVSDATVFNPDLGIPRGEGEIDVGILGENGGMRFDFALFDLPLVCNPGFAGRG